MVKKKQYKPKSTDIGKNMTIVIILAIIVAVIFMFMFPYTTVALLILLGITAVVLSVGYMLSMAEGGLAKALLKKGMVFLVLIAIVGIGISEVSAVGNDRQVVSKKMLESQYSYLGNIPDWLSLGDRIYQVTYSDGSTQKILKRVQPILDIGRLQTPLQKATIVEGGYSTLWQTAGQTISLNFRVQGVNLPLVATGSCTSAAGATTCSVHRFELDDITTGYMNVLTTAQSQEFVKEYSYEGKHTITIPAQGAGKRTYELKEFVLLKDGTWMPGAATASSDTTFDAIWTSATQAGTTTPIATPVPTVAPPNPSYTPSAAAVQVKVDSNPTGATVQVNGASVGNTPVMLTVFPSDGTLPIVLSKGGYVTKYTTFSASTQSPYVVTLDKITAPAGGSQSGGSGAQNGYIIVWSDPSGAKVSVNGAPSGTTGTDWLSIPEPASSTQYEVKVELSSYSTYTESVIVKANDNVQVVARLAATGTPNPTATPPPGSSGSTGAGTGTNSGGGSSNGGNAGTGTPPPPIQTGVTPTATPAKSPEFEAVFAIAGLIIVAYLVLRQKSRN